MLDQQGGDQFFGEPALDLADLMLLAPDGRGAVNILAADKLINGPRLYATFLLWLLSELFEELPEVGDLEKPKLVFFFDEAHLLFNDAPKALVEKVEQVVRLIRSKGVGVYFVTQNPLDLPDTVLGQLGNRVQHALRAFTPRDQKAVPRRRRNLPRQPRPRRRQAITELDVGEALVSCSTPRPSPPSSSAPRSCRQAAASARSPRPNAPTSSPAPPSPAATKPRWTANPPTKCSPAAPPQSPISPPVPRPTTPRPPGAPRPQPPSPGTNQPPRRPAEPPARKPRPTRLMSLLLGSGRREGVGEAFAKSMARSLGGQVGRSVMRGLLGSIAKRR